MIFYYIMLYYIILYYIVLHYTILYVYRLICMCVCSDYSLCIYKYTYIYIIYLYTPLYIYINIYIYPSIYNIYIPLDILICIRQYTPINPKGTAKPQVCFPYFGSLEICCWLATQRRNTRQLENLFRRSNGICIWFNGIYHCLMGFTIV